MPETGSQWMWCSEYDFGMPAYRGKMSCEKDSRDRADARQNIQTRHGHFGRVSRGRPSACPVTHSSRAPRQLRGWAASTPRAGGHIDVRRSQGTEPGTSALSIRAHRKGETSKDAIYPNCNGHSSSATSEKSQRTTRVKVLKHERSIARECAPFAAGASSPPAVRTCRRLIFKQTRQRSGWCNTSRCNRSELRRGDRETHSCYSGCFPPRSPNYRTRLVHRSPWPHLGDSPGGFASWRRDERG